MSDQGKWFKLWCSALDDAELENLEIHQWFCWARFGAYLKKHGISGSIFLKAPCRVLQLTFRVNSYEEVIEMLLSFPNILLSTSAIRWPHGYSKEPVCDGEILWGRREGERGVSTPHEESVRKVLEKGFVFVSLYNWNKYQADKSTQRVKSFREKRGVNETVNVTPQEEKRSRREKKRRDVFAEPTVSEVEAYGLSINFKVDGEALIAHYRKTGWKVKGTPITDWKSCVVTWKKNNFDKAPNQSTQQVVI